MTTLLFLKQRFLTKTGVLTVWFVQVSHSVLELVTCYGALDNRLTGCFPLVSFVGGLVVVFKLPLSRAQTIAAIHIGKHSLLAPIIRRKAASFNLIVRPEHLPPALATANSRFWRWPGSVLLCRMYLKRVVASVDDKLASLLPVHLALRVAVVDNATQRVETLFLVVIRQAVAQPDDVLVLFWCFLVVRMLQLPVCCAVWLIVGHVLLAKLLVAIIQPVSLYIAPVVGIGGPAGSLGLDGAERIRAKDDSSEVHGLGERKRGNGGMAVDVGVKLGFMLATALIV